MELCSICLEELNKNIIILDCNHRFHQNCINKYITYKNINNFCPNCRSEINANKIEDLKENNCKIDEDLIEEVNLNNIKYLNNFPMPLLLLLLFTKL